MDSMQAKKRFYKDVATDAGDDGWVIKLDNRKLRSPAGALVHVPSPALAAAVADEWRAHDEYIDAASMPQFSLAVTVIDRVIPQQPVIRRELSGYGLSLIHI